MGHMVKYPDLRDGSTLFDFYGNPLTGSFAPFLPVFNVAAPPYRADPTGATDSTAAVLAAITAAQNAGGGIVYFPPGTYLILGGLSIPNDGAVSQPRQKPVRLMGAMATSYGYWTGAGVTIQASVLDMRYNGGGAAVAKIDTRGAGLLEIDHLTLLSRADDYPFFQTTNTTVQIHDNAVLGNRTKSGQNCVQDAWRLGGNGITNQDLNPNSFFQGYGSKIQNNFYDQIRRCVIFGAQSNGVEVENETVSKSCGSSTAIDGPFYFDGGGAGGGAAGVKIRGGTVEVTNYPYTVVMNHTSGSIFDAIGSYDDSGVTVAPIYCDANSTANLAIQPFYGQAAYFAGPNAFDQTYISGFHTPNRSNFAQGLIVGNNSGKGLDCQLIRVGANGTLTSVNDAAPAGGQLIIDTGTGGSNLTMKAATYQIEDASGNLEAKIYTGGSMDLCAGTATPSGGALGSRLNFGSGPALGIYFGSGAPGVAAPKGSLYLRTDGTTTNNRMYVNTDGGTTWTAVTTVA